MRKIPLPQETFYNGLKELINNLLINNPNYKTDYYRSVGFNSIPTKLVNCYNSKEL